MIKIIIFLVALVYLSVPFSNASSRTDEYKEDIVGNLSLYSGANFVELSAVFGFKVAFEIFCFRASFDVGKTFIKHPLSEEGITTVSPCVGLFYGKQEKIYAMIGCQNYGYINNNLNPPRFRSDHIYGLVRVGFQHFFMDRLFLNLELTHLFNDNKPGTVHFPNSNVCIGVGLAF